MAKATSPIRLQADLMEAAEQSARRQHRSTAEQIEYWADMGRQVSDVLDPDILLAIASGLSRIHVEQINAKPIDPEQVFQALENDRATGTLTQSISKAPVRYQVSEEHPGYLEQIDTEGEITTGTFKNGEFIPLNKPSS